MSIDALTLQVNEIKSLLKTILKGKAKEMDPEEMIIEPPKASKKMSKKKKPAHRSASLAEVRARVPSDRVGALLLLRLLPLVPLHLPPHDSHIFILKIWTRI